MKIRTLFILIAILGISALAPSRALAVEDPYAEPGPGQYENGIRVVLSSDEPANHIIKFTKDGQTPGCQSTRPGTIYTTPIRLIVDTTIKALTCTSPTTPSNEMEFVYDFIAGSSGGGGGGSDPTETPYGPTCETDPAVCPPGTPSAADAYTPLLPPVFGNVLANTISTFTRDLSIGTSGSDVSILQWFLITKRVGPASLALARVGATGQFGPLTRDAVIEFQKRVGVSQTGYVGPQTRARINAQSAALPVSATTGTPSVIIVPPVTPTLTAPVSGGATTVITAPTSGGAL